jgi:hypothetical protein
MARLAAHDGAHGLDDRAKLGGDFKATVVPTHIQTQGLDDVVGPDRRIPRRLGGLARIGRDPVDVGQRQSGVSNRLPDSIDSQKQRMAGQAHPDL